MRRFPSLRSVLCVLALTVSLAALPAPSQQFTDAAVIPRIDAAVQARFQGIASFTAIEHYALFRDNDETHPAAEMTVKAFFEKDSGKTYTILSQSGSVLIRKLVFGPLLDNEKTVNSPGIREKSWFTSSNYEMHVKPGPVQQLDGRDCIAVTINPRRKAPNMIVGTIWVDTHDFSMVRIEGVQSKSSSPFTSPAQVFRQYAKVSGFAEATHARAESTGPLIGHIVVTIDYSGYQVRLSSSH